MGEAPRRPGERRCLWYLLPGCAAALAAALNFVVWSLDWPWSAARLSPTFALAHGYRLYYGPDQGPVLNTLYGPVTALVYLPATLASSPTAALLVAGAISALLYFLPVACVLLGGQRGEPRNLAIGGVALACFALLTERSTALSYSAFSVHADAPALGFGALACLFAYRRRDPRDRGLLTLSAGAAVLAVWSKQTMVPLLAALPLFLAAVEGRAAALRFVGFSALLGLASLALFWAVFDGPAMVFNLLVLPAGHPLKLERTKAALSGLGGRVLPFAVILAAYGWYRALPAAAGQRMAWRTWLAGNRWALFVLVAIVNAPLCILNYLKVGGDQNAFSLAVYYLMIATFVTMVDEARGAGTTRPSVSRVARGALTVSLVVLAALSVPRSLRLPEVLQLLHENDESRAYQTIREKPGRIYLPEHPLAHIMAENQVYHFSYALLDRRLGGHPVSRDHFLAHIPGEMEGVLFSPLTDADERLREEIRGQLPGLLPAENEGEPGARHPPSAPAHPGGVR